MSRAAVLFQQVSFVYDTASVPLFANLHLHFPIGWTGIIGANGYSKTTLLQLAIGNLEPQQGHVQSPADAVYCPQRTDEQPPFFDALLNTMDGYAQRLKGQLGVAETWRGRWHTLSHGERKRAQIGVALWQHPQVLAIDEPTNHLDAAARDLLITALHSFQGVGLLVSHDRALLDTLCQQCVFIDPPQALLRPGGFSQGSRQAKADTQRTNKQYDQAKRERQRIEREVSRRRVDAEQAHHKRSKRGLAKKDHDARFQKNLARVTGRDGVGGKLLHQLDARLGQARQKEDAISVKKTYTLGIWMKGTQSKRNTLFSLPACRLPLGPGRRLHVPSLSMRPDDRIVLTGANGSGKSTLITRLLKTVDLPPERVTYIPQEIPHQRAKKLVTQTRSLAKEELGQLMTIISRLGSRPHRLLETGQPSPGEIRKLLLALGIVHTPHLIIMDEPTNHLDLPSIECLEEALQDCPCGLLLVSHDECFLSRLTKTRWQITKRREESSHADMALRIAEVDTRQAIG